MVGVGGTPKSMLCVLGVKFDGFWRKRAVSA
jgi:hypothetical protein